MKTHAIIGGGLSGTLTAIKLLQKSDEPIVIHLFEKDYTQLFKGVAYSSQLGHQLLNVPANHMSLYQEQPNHFCDWLHNNGHQFSPNEFVPRNLFGDYLAEEINHAQQKYPQHQLIVHQTEVLQINSIGIESFEIISDNKVSTILANEVWLCTGNFKPMDLKNTPKNVKASSGYISNPWDGRQMTNIHPEATVLIIGSGLTMVDQVLSLHKKNHRGKITVVSRRGFAPQPHGTAQPYNFSTIPDFTQTRLVEIMRWFNGEINTAKLKGFDWRSVINALRDYAPVIWKNLSDADKKSFLSHLRPFWEIHRHRVPLDSWQKLQLLIVEGKLEIIAARIKLMEKSGGKIKIRVKPRNVNHSIELTFDWVINCTGPESMNKDISSPLFSSLLNQGLVQADSMGIGLLVSDELLAINMNGKEVAGLHIIGPPGKGGLWECTALREIKLQTEKIGKRQYQHA
jgi:uncharacterized NAD(P)/FAD-binding protein YdhS